MWKTEVEAQKIQQNATENKTRNYKCKSPKLTDNQEDTRSSGNRHKREDKLTTKQGK